MVKIAVIIVTLTLFFTAAFAEIGGGYLVWLWLRKNKVLLFGLVGGMVLFVYGIIQTLQPANFGRVYAAVWWHIRSFIYYMGSTSGQKETR